MPLEIHEVKSVADFPEIVRVCGIAYEAPYSPSGEIFKPVFGHGPTAWEDAYRGMLTRLWFIYSIDPKSRWFKVIDTDLDEKIVAAAQWHTFEETPPKNPAQIDPYWWGEGEKRKFARMWLENTAEMRLNRPPHVRLSIIFTHPDHRRRGAANLLMKWGTDTADRLGLPCYVDGTPMGVPLYLANDFQIIKEFLIKPDVPEEEKSEEWKKMEERMVETMTLMRRDPKSTKKSWLW